MATRMCKKCKRLVKGDKCPVCKTESLTETWKGRILVIDANKSELAKKMLLAEAGEYGVR